MFINYFIHSSNICKFHIFHSHNYCQIFYDFCLEPPKTNGPVSELMIPLDDVILDFMTEQDIPGASFALSRDGNMVYCQGKVICFEKN